MKMIAAVEESFQNTHFKKTVPPQLLSSSYAVNSITKLAYHSSFELLKFKLKSHFQQAVMTHLDNLRTEENEFRPQPPSIHRMKSWFSWAL